ncbi:MAG TPA: hypothetical protein VHQ00_05010 [Chloroflexota bacterium]|nr:hypothetical protein [Chloroflexota bacterium]
MNTRLDTNTPLDAPAEGGAREAPAPRRAPRRAPRTPSLRRFTPQERERLQRLRQAVRDGQRSESLPVDRRQDFVRWLIANGRLSES